MSKRNFRAEMAAKTAGLRSTNEVVVDNQGQSGPRIPRTGPGQLGALTAAQLRIRELEGGAGKRKVPVDSLSPNPWQPRREFDEAALNELATNIKENSLLQAIVVRRDPFHAERYQIVMGERRWRAQKLLGMSDIDAVVGDFSDVQMAITALSENLNREDLSDFEISRSLTVIEREFPTRKEVAEVIGISRTQLHRLNAFQKLPDFVLSDLAERPRLLGASAASDVVSALDRHGKGATDVLQGLWDLLKQGKLEQGRLAPGIDLKMAKADLKTDAKLVSRSDGHIRTLFRAGTKAGDIRKDGRHLLIRLNNAAVDEEMEQKIREFLDHLFPLS